MFIWDEELKDYRKMTRLEMIKDWAEKRELEKMEEESNIIEVDFSEGEQLNFEWIMF